MAEAQNFAYTSLAHEDAITLTIDGVSYEVVQFAANFAINEIPTAQCMLAVGRNARTGAAAQINATAESLRAMKRAQVRIRPDGDYTPDGDKWPADGHVVFDGYYCGHSYVKSHGKVFIVIHLTHWLADLGFTSCLNAVTHAPSPAALAFPSIMDPIAGPGGVMQGGFISSLVGANAVRSLIANDLWEALKTLFCGMAFFEGFNPASAPGMGGEQLKKNNRARKALQAIEGPGKVGGGSCAKDYQFGRALRLNGPTGQSLLGIGNAICHVFSTDMVHHTLWDAMVGYYCPMFGIDILPMATRAVVTASLPGYNGGTWRTIRPEEYDYIDQTAELPKPLRGVVVHGNMLMPGGTNGLDEARSGVPYFAGSYAVPPAQQDGDGAVLFVSAPSWLNEMVRNNRNAADTTGQGKNKAGNAATTPGQGEKGQDPPPAVVLQTTVEMMNKFAQTVFIQNMLRGRTGTVSGKLRFDIGPGSHLELIGSPERFIGAEDQLASTMYGQVTRVTVEANAESRRAATAFGLSYMRNKTENGDERTSSATHPFFENGVVNGVPLIDAYAEK